MTLPLSLVLSACSEDDRNPVGAGDVPPAGDSIQEVVLSAVQTETFLTGTDDRGFGTLLVAAHDEPDSSGFESRVLLRFALTIPDTTRGPVSVDSATVRLITSDVLPDPVAFRVHRVLEAWREGEVTWDEREFDVAWGEPGGTFDAAPLGERTLTRDSSTFALPDTLVQRWLDSPGENNGVILLLDAVDSHARVTAASTTTLPTEQGPRLRIFLTVGDSSSVSDVLATADAYIATFEGPVAPGLAVGNEPFFRSVLKFDVAQVPVDANINLAELRLAPRQVVTPVDSLELELRRVVSPLLGGSTVFSTSVLDSASVRAGSVLTFSGPALANIVRAWQRDPALNLGVGIQAGRRFGNLGFAVYAESADAAAEAPSLRIIFTPALRPDFGRRSR